MQAKTLSIQASKPGFRKLLMLPFLVALIVFVVGVLVTLLLWANEQHNVLEKMETRFDAGMREFDNLMANRIYDYEQVLLGMRSLFAATGSVSRKEFRDYVENLNLAKAYPGAHGVNYSIVVPPAQKDHHITTMRSEGIPEYAIKPDSGRDFYTATIYLEPFSGDNKLDLGFDNYTDATRRAAMEHARDTGELSISGKTNLFTDNNKDQPGVHIYLAVYRKGGATSTVDERRENLLGWLCLALRMDDFMQDVMKTRFERLDIEMYDGSVMSRETLLYDSDGDTAQSIGETDALFQVTQTIGIRGHVWTISGHSLPDFDAQLEEGRQGYILYSGISGSLLAALLAGLLLYGRARIQQEKAEIARGESRLSAVIETALDAVIQIDAEGRVIGWNNQARTVFGWTREEVLGKVLEELIIPVAHRRTFRASMKKFLVAPEDFTSSIKGSALNARAEMTAIRSDGSEFPVELSMTQNILADGSFQFTAFFRDITKQREREEAQRLASIVLNTVEEAVMVMDTELKIVNVNPAFTKITGYTAGEVVGKTPAILSAGKHTPEFRRKMLEDITGKGIWQGEIWDRHKNGDTYIKWLTTKAVCDEKGNVTHYLGVFFDISERKAAEERMKRLAHHDTLTDLPNRILFNDRLRQAMSKAKRDKGRLALKFIDLDKFKPVNDTYGHAVGDLLLKEVAARLLDCVRESDTVSRIGGDEFVILLPSVDGEPDAMRVAEKILHALNEPFDVAGHRLSISSSIGIAIYPDHGEDEGALTKKADIAMYHAKNSGRNNAMIYRADMPSSS